AGGTDQITQNRGYVAIPEVGDQVMVGFVHNHPDPLAQGRITVRFDWQLHDTTNFIRMMAPDAGGTDQITQNRGYVAIPEVGDQVMVGFVHNHP
ncbi:phage baseplate assembly protein V, partial [Chryseobacterium sp. CH1]|uniref:phage baseplate assembly protein V n=1 Tax=Chryseobacterium sp. CH1 TaxID=713551 RepID=UPI0010285510